MLIKIKTKYVILFILYLLVAMAQAQNRLQVQVSQAENRQPLVGANVYFDSLQIGASTDANGRAQIDHIPNGRHTLIVSYVGFQTKKIALSFPRKNPNRLLSVLLEPVPFSSDQIVVTSTRNNSILAEMPVRIQVLGKEEIMEEIAIRPGNVSKFLGESSSIITQQTSAVSGAVSFRLQGLPARYTKMLKDGFPDFSGLASGFSPLQIPPLDLRQIEIARGAYSPLFTDGALAGVINLISKEPSQKPHLDVLLNRTHRQGTDIGSFFSGRYDKLGLTLLVSQSLQNPVDVDRDGFSDIPKFRQGTINPRLFYNFGRGASLVAGISSFFENRSGGDMQAVERGRDSVHTYSEKYEAKRIGLNLHFRKQFTDSSALTFKSSLQNYDQTADFPQSYFSGTQYYGYAEAGYFKPWKHHKWVAGVSLIYHSFKQAQKKYSSLYDSRFTTLGLFVQDDWNFAAGWTVHGALRWDYRRGGASFLLPHAALLFNAAENIKFRVSAGLGYSMPTLLDVAPQQDFFTYRIEPSFSTWQEKSRDVAMDTTYRYAAGDFALSINQAFMPHG